MRYLEQYQPDHPAAYSNGCIQEHWAVIEQHTGIAPRRGSQMQVHHVNRNPSDNRPQNLVVCENGAYHMLLHRRQRAIEATGNPNALKCSHCQKWSTPSDPEIRTTTCGPQNPSVRAFHRSCANEYQNQRRRL